MTDTDTAAAPTTTADLPDDPHSPRGTLAKVLIVAIVVLLVAELAVRILEPRLPPPPDWYTPEYSIKQAQMHRLADDRDGASVAVIGSSVVDVAVDPDRMHVDDGRPVYNAGLIGANPEMVDQWSRLVVEPTLDPDTVVFGVSSRDVNAGGLELEGQTAGFYDLPAMRHLLGRESIAEQVERRAGDLSRLVRYRTALRRPLESLFDYDPPDRNVEHNTDLGLELHLADLTYSNAPNVQAFFRANPLRAFAVSPTELAAVRDAATRLRKAGKRVVILDVPVTQDYIDLHPNGAADYEAYETALHQVADAAGADYVDAGVWPTEGFSDPLHLNGVGTTELTEQLDGYLADGTVTYPAGGHA